MSAQKRPPTSQYSHKYFIYMHRSFLKSNENELFRTSANTHIIFTRSKHRANFHFELWKFIQFPGCTETFPAIVFFLSRNFFLLNFLNAEVLTFQSANFRSSSDFARSGIFRCAITRLETMAFVMGNRRLKSEMSLSACEESNLIDY